MTTQDSHTRSGFEPHDHGFPDERPDWYQGGGMIGRLVLFATRFGRARLEICGNEEWDSRYECVKPKGHPAIGPGLTDHDYRNKDNPR